MRARATGQLTFNPSMFVTGVTSDGPRGPAYARKRSGFADGLLAVLPRGRGYPAVHVAR